MSTPAFHRILLACALIPLNAMSVTMDFVTVGNPGNAADPANSGSIPGIGAVNATFGIGTYEVTDSQYAEFLNKVDGTGANPLGLYDSQMGSTAWGGILFNPAASVGSKYSVRPGFGNMPVVYVSFFDAVRFTNWLHNGQGSGGTETGAYTLSGGTTTPANAVSVTRNSGAQFWLPSESEWYKAAYFQPAGLGGDSDNYWQYPMRTNLQPFSDQPPGVTPDNTRVGNFFASDSLPNGYDDGYAATGSLTIDGVQNNLTAAGAYTLSKSFFGTFDQGGNVAEWNDTTDGIGGREVRGGSWDVTELFQRASFRLFLDQSDSGSGNAFGFRVATVPEPAALGMALFGALCLASRRKQRA